MNLVRLVFIYSNLQFMKKIRAEINELQITDKSPTEQKKIASVVPKIENGKTIPILKFPFGNRKISVN